MERMTSPPRPPLDRQAHTDAAWTLVRWIGIPLILVAALYFIQRAYDGHQFTVVTSQGPMLTPEEMAAAHPVQPQPPQAPATSTPAPLVPTAPTTSEPTMPLQPGAAPQLLSQPNPTYPPRALEAEREGTVRLRLTIAPDGHVADARVLHAEPSGWFESAAEDGVKRWRYAPSEFGGTADVDVEFKLN